MKSLFCITVVLFVHWFSVPLEAQQINWALYNPVDQANYGQFHEGLASFYQNGKYGIINSQGETVLAPTFKYNFTFEDGVAIVQDSESLKYGVVGQNGQYILQPVYSSIRKYDYLLAAKNEEGKEAVYSLSGEELLPAQYSVSKIETFPLLTIASSEEKFIYNLNNDSIYEIDYVTQCGKLYAVKKDSLYIDREGNEVFFNEVNTSSTGTKLFYDAQGPGIIKSNRDTIRLNYLVYPYIYDYAVACKADGKNVIYDKDGNQLPGEYVGVLMGNYGALQTTTSSDYVWDVIDNKGNMLFKGNGAGYIENPTPYLVIAYEIGDKGSVTLIDMENSKVLKKYKSVEPFKEGFARVQSLDGKYGFVDAKGREVIPVVYEQVEDFNEGLALVKRGNNYMFINVSGKVVLSEDAKWRPSGSFSEGVAAAYDKANGKYGFIYNPLLAGEDRPTYSQNSSQLAEVYFSQGYDLMEKKQYGDAAKCFLETLKHNSAHSNAWNNLGVCFDNLGSLESALKCFRKAYEIDDTNTVAKNNIANVADRINASQQQTENASSGNWVDALMNIGNALVEMGNAMENGGNQNYNSGNQIIESSNDVSPVHLGNQDNNQKSGKSATYYQTQYNNWARRAEANYNTLTSSGYSIEKGNKAKGAAKNSSQYVMQKKLLREAQREMQKCRLEASREGITIMKSKYEDAQVEVF
ncbi:WG repeat-containing protein [Parabacteroides pacaensis]|uniref:WG repeat-containing protein n=1 Tax=Parabacteroides pacaensis TaxID=2086575 RepID=UPI000D10AF95|nr:WG repeat-containing protein [Parabacteroides pacaensis]